MKTLLLAISLMVVFEGLMPMINPSVWKHALERLTKQDDELIRRLGIIMVVAGLASVWLIDFSL